MSSLFSKKTILITGSSRGIGKAMALRLAREGANIIVAAKSVEEDPRLGGTIYSAAREIEEAGGHAFPVVCDIRDEAQIEEAVSKGVQHFGGLDILINNASAISISSIERTEPKRFDLMYDINVRGTFFMVRACIPHLLKSSHAHVLSLSPPLNMDMKWFAPHPAYTISKYDMTMITLSVSRQYQGKIAANTLWPKTIIATAALKILPGGEQLIPGSRHPEMVADAAFEILRKEPSSCTGHSFIDEEVLAAAGITDFTRYAVSPDQPLIPDLFM